MKINKPKIDLRSFVLRDYTYFFYNNIQFNYHTNIFESKTEFENVSTHEN